MWDYSFEKANRLDWSNEHLDSVIAMRLLLLVYDTRPEADDFRQRRIELNTKCLDDVDDIPGLAKELREAFPVGPYGRSREETNKTLSEFMGNLLSTVNQEILSQLGSTNSDTSKIDFSNIDLSIVQDPIMRDTIQKFLVFIKQYAKDYENVGGEWMPDVHTINNTVKHANNSSLKNNLFSDPRILRLISYREDLIRLYYEYGLKCWLAPDYYFIDELARWGGSVPVEELASPTLDGVLGPLFRREITDTLKAQPGEATLSDDSYKEWLLLAMSRQEMRRDFGIAHSQKIHEQMEDWNYHHNNKWEQSDFDMLFDRIYLNLSIEKIAENYDCEVSTVQRRTSYLANLLQLELPRAPYTK